MEKNVLELTRKRFGNSTGLKLFEDLVFFIASKAGCISHAVPNYVPMIEKGLTGLVKFASEKEKECLTSGNKEAMAKAEFYQAVQIALNGILEYACHLAEKAELLASITADADQKKELEEMAACCRRVPAHPAISFREAAENINMAMSPGRLDQLLYPYYRRDIEAGRLTVEQALEILGCLWFKLADNVIMVPEASEEMFGGAGTAPALTLGGVDSNGEDAVNDLTYIMLKVTELLRIRDPNVTARYYYGKNPQEYINRVSEVILNTKAVPALYNDAVNIEALIGQGESLEHARDYAVVGCVELASNGRDYPASSSIMLNLASSLEMALFCGKRPITG